MKFIQTCLKQCFHFQAEMLFYGLVPLWISSGDSQLWSRVLGWTVWDTGELLHQLSSPGDCWSSCSSRSAHQRTWLHCPGAEPEEPEDMTISVCQHCQDAGQTHPRPLQHPQEETSQEEETQTASSGARISSQHSQHHIWKVEATERLKASES